MACVGDATPNRLRGLREARGLTQIALAERVSISRQSLSAIEAGRADPSVSLALRLASTLECRVEDLFAAAPVTEQLRAVKAGTAVPVRGTPTRLALAFLRERWVAHPLAVGEPSALQYAADGLSLGRAGEHGSRIRVELLHPAAEAKETVVLLGCAPALGLLVQRLNRSKGAGRFLWLERTSTAALDGLRRGFAHVAGVHMADGASAHANVPAVRRHVPRARLTLVTLARWQAGLVLRAGNPLRVRGVGDLARPRLRLAGREPGAGARLLLEQRLRAAKLAPARLLRAALELHGHLQVAQAVALGAADVGVAIEHAAIAHGLAFEPLAEERFDLVLPYALLQDARIARMLDVLTGAAFRRELDALGGYDTSECGRTVAV
jgi:molybdate-binding protein/DNA-binding XRE family transcriptional regulator